MTHTYYSNLDFASNGDVKLEIIDAEIEVDSHHQVSFKTHTVVIMNVEDGGEYFTVHTPKFKYKFQKTFQRKLIGKQIVKVLFM